MPAVAVNGDTAGGAVTGTCPVTIDGSAIAQAGDGVAPHPPPTPPHQSATMTASGVVTTNGVAWCLSGDAATCSHTIAASSVVTVD